MLLVIVTCPSCDFSREYESTRIPPGSTTATCPKCGGTFTLVPGAVTPSKKKSTEDTGAPQQPTAVIRESEAAVTSAPEASCTPPPPPAPPYHAAPRGFQKQRLQFTFAGKARDYFGIWIVNTMLKIVTLGIYSAWAKVRKRRYFYGNTLLDQVPFEYLADPFALFKGWLIAAVFFILYSFGSKLNPLLASLFSLLFFIGMPWLIVRSRVFNLRYSAHRSIRFTFAPNYGEAYLAFAALPCLIPFTLGLITPYMIYRQKKFLVENSGYGRTRCTFHATAGDYYLVFLKALGWLAVTLVVMGMAALWVFQTIRSASPLFAKLGPYQDKVEVITWLLSTLAGGFILYLYFTIYLRTALANLTWNSTCIKKSRFSSTLRIVPMAWLYLSSAVAVLFSCGLLIPWATVRLTRYKMDNLALELNDDHESFLGWGHRDVGSTGEEIGDMFGIEIGL